MITSFLHMQTKKAQISFIVVQADHTFVVCCREIVKYLLFICPKIEDSDSLP